MKYKWWKQTSNVAETNQPEEIDIRTNILDKTIQECSVDVQFNSFLEVKESIKEYEKKHFVQLRVSSGVGTGSYEEKKTLPKRVANANLLLEYYVLFCKVSGNANTVATKRNTKSSRQNSPFQIRLCLSDNGKYLKVTKIVENHNHLISKPLSKHLPRQRSLNDEELAFVKNAMLIKENNTSKNTNLYWEEDRIKRPIKHTTICKRNIKWESDKRSGRVHGM